MADNIARIYGEHERRHAESALEAYQRHLMELHRMEARVLDVASVVNTSANT